MLVAEFGKPTLSEVKNGKKQDVFVFTQGYGKGGKTLRALGHGAADVFTLGFWEIVGTPIENSLDGTDMAYEVLYDEVDDVQKVKLLKKR